MKKKNIAAMLLAGAMCFGLLAGCGGGNSGSGGGTPADDTPASEAPAQGGESSGEAVTIKVGSIGPLTGDLAQYGTATDWGAQVAVAEINALNGPIKLDYNAQDDTGVLETAVAAYNTLKDWAKDEPLVIYGTTTTGPCVGVSAETNGDRYFQLTPSASSPDVTAGKDNVFQMCFTDPNQGKTAASYVKEHGLGTKIGVIYNNGDAYSTGIAQGFIEEAANLGVDVVTTQTYPADTTTDFTVQLNACKEGGADLVFMPIYYTPASLILAQAKQMSYAPTFFGGDGMDGMLDMEGFDKSLAEGLMLITPFNASAEDSRTTGFVESYKKLSGGVTPNQFAADGYDCMYAIYEACCKIDGIGEMDHTQLCDALIAMFTGGSFQVDGLTGTEMSWQTNGEVSKALMVVRVENGAYVMQ